MDKGTKKTEKFSYNRQVIKTIAEKFGLSDYYTRQCVAGRRDGVVPDKIRKEYRTLDRALELKKEQFLNQEL